MLDLSIKKRLRHFPLEVELQLDIGVMVIVGHSGCGKSTTLNAIAGLVTPEEGVISVHGKKMFDSTAGINFSPEQREMGFVFQNYALFPHMTVTENIGYGLEARGVPKNERKARIHQIAEGLGISHLLDQLPADCSGGEQQRVALARALVIEPELLLLDEPLSALDVTTRSRVRRELKKILNRLGIPTIIVTHDYDDAISLGDRIVVMDQGRVIQQGTAEELLFAPKSAFVADFSGTNYFTAHVLRRVRNGVELHFNEHTSPIIFYPGDVEEDTVSIMIHPWEVELYMDQPQGRDGAVLKAIVEHIQFYGNRTRIDVQGDLALMVDLPYSIYAGHKVKKGDEVFLYIRNDRIHLLTESAKEMLLVR